MRTQSTRLAILFLFVLIGLATLAGSAFAQEPPVAGPPAADLADASLVADVEDSQMDTAQAGPTGSAAVLQGGDGVNILANPDLEEGSSR